MLPSPAFAPARPALLHEEAAAGNVPMIARFLPSLTDLAFLLPVIYVFFQLNGARTLLGDGDTGWHIRTGEWILAHRQVPHTDLFSFSRPNAPWFAWEWLWDVVFAMLHRSAGMAAVVIASLLVICLTTLVSFRLVRRSCDNGLVAIAVTLLATGACSIHWLARPHLFTLLFFVITLHITDRAAEGRTSLLVWLVPLTLLWTNIHGGFFVVLLVLGCYIGSDLLNAAIEPDPAQRTAFLRSVKPWLAAALGCAVVTLINPYGWQLHKHVVDYITDPYQLQHISEFQAMNFHSPVVVYFEPMMVLALLTAFWDAGHRRFANVFMTLGWLHLALVAQRNLPLFAIATGPLLARGIVAAINSVKSAGAARWTSRAAGWFNTATSQFEETDRLWRTHLVSILPMVLIGALLLAPKPAGAKFISTYDPAVYPETAMPVLQSPGTHRIFAMDQWGDYLIYRLYPSKRVFIDGRSDFYGDAFGEKYLDLINVQYDWEEILDKYSIDTILISPKDALTSTLKISRDWRVVHDDGVAVVFRRNVDSSRVPVSLVSSNERKIRDRAITKAINSDPGITQPTT
jgi:hypothetical protein